MTADYLNEKDIVYRVFNEVQGETTKQDQFSEILANVYCHDPETFVVQLSNCINAVLCFRGGNKDTDNLIHFISTVVSRCIGNVSIPVLSPLVIQDLLSHTKAKERYVRLRCLTIINQILIKSKSIDLEEKTLRKLKQVYMERSRDKVIAVRSAAAVGLCSLQNAFIGENDLITLLAQNMCLEANSYIRNIYSESIIVNPLTISAIISRLRDDDVTVRQAILKNLREHTTIQQLPLQLRLAVVRCLQDRNDVIVRASEDIIIKNWVNRNPVLLLLSLFNLDEEEETCELLLNVIFQYEQKNNSKEFTSKASISINQLTSLTSFYLYSIIRFYFEQGHESDIETYIPDIPQFCALIKNCLTSVTTNSDIQKSVYANTTRCVQYLDSDDESCRQEIIRLLRYILSAPSGANTSLLIDRDNIHVLLQACLNVLNSEEAFMSEISLIMSDLEDLREDIRSQHITSHSCIVTEDQSMMFMLYITQSTFQLISSAAFSRPEVQCFFDMAVRSNLQSPIPQLRREAVKGLILSGIMNRSIAYQFSSLLLCMILEEDEDPDVQIVAINGLTDIAIVYGDMKIQATEDSELGVSLDEIIEGCCMYLFNQNEILQNVSCQALCKLFMFDKLRSVHILSSLIILLFDSATAKKIQIRQTLAVFFPSYCNPEIDKNCLFLEEAAVYTMKGIAEANITERYTMISQFGKFFLSLMTMNLKKSEKRYYLASDDEGETVDQDCDMKLDSEYHRCARTYIIKLVDISKSKIDDTNFMKEVVSTINFVDPEFMNHAHRVEFNKIVVDMYNLLSNNVLRRQLKSKNKTLCTNDPSLEKI